ncbi:hypothetical protein LguiB_013858 [Lonicera macranthoides]
MGRDEGNREKGSVFRGFGEGENEKCVKEKSISGTRTTSDPPPPPPPAPSQNPHSRLSLLHILYPRIKLGLTRFAAFSLLSHSHTVSQHHCSTPPIHHHHRPCLSSPNIGEQKLKDFDIEREAKGVDKVVKINFKAIIKDKSLEIRFHYAGKGTTAVLMRGIYVPLISAISVKSGKTPPSSPTLIRVKIGDSVQDTSKFGYKMNKSITMENDVDGLASESILAEKVKSQEEELKSQEEELKSQKEELTAVNERIRQLEGQYADIREMVRQLKETPEAATGSNTNQR